MSGNTALVWDSGIWANGQQRNLTKDGELDPYDPTRFSIHSGVNGRRTFIDGNGNLFQSGDKSRFDIITRVFNPRFETFLTFNPTLDHITIRLRSRREETGLDANKFGGYLAVIYRDEVKFYRENTKNDYDDLDPVSVTLTREIEDGEEFHLIVNLFHDAEIGDTQEVKVQMDFLDGFGLSTRAVAIDATPAAHILNQVLYKTLSYTSVRIHGDAGANPYDVKFRNMRIFDKGDFFIP